MIYPFYVILFGWLFFVFYDFVVAQRRKTDYFVEAWKNPNFYKELPENKNRNFVTREIDEHPSGTN